MTQQLSLPNNGSLTQSLVACRVANLAFWKPDFEIQAFFDALGFSRKSKIPVIIWLFLFYSFQSERVGSGKTLSDLHIHYKSLLTGVYDHAGCKEYCKDFTVALKITDVTDRKQMYDSVSIGQENASKLGIALY